MIIGNFIGIIGVSLCAVANVYALCSGRLIFGFASGMFLVTVPKMIEETVPVNLVGTYGSATTVSISLGSLIAIMLSSSIPEDSKTSDLQKNQQWRAIMLFPLIL